MNPLSLRDPQGRVVDLGDSVGRGGEAVVYRVSGQPTRLAKIYDPAPRPNYHRKLAWMVDHPPLNPTISSNHASLAWPDMLVFDPRGHLKGYLMPFIRRTVPLLDVFNPRRRVRVWPQFDTRYLHRVARNLATALDALHNSGYVAGDLNESNVLVTASALVTLIDTDSFQVTEASGEKEIVYSCPVGKFEYTAPELQGRHLADVVRRPEQDSFALAVLVFQLLMEGNHPFRAQWLGKGEPPQLQDRIASGAFPYTSAPSLVVLPPKNAPDIHLLHPRLVELFRRTFVDGHASPGLRPSASQWRDGIDEAEQSLVVCPARHVFSNHLSECPHCARAGRRSPMHQAVPIQPVAVTRGASPAQRGSSWQGAPGQAAPARAAPAPRPSGVAGSHPAYGARPGGSAPPPTLSWRSQAAPSASAPAARSGSGRQPAPWLKPAQPQGALTWPRRSAGSPWQSAPRPAPPRPAQPRPASVRNWLWQRTYRSFLYGGSNGVIAGALPGMLMGLVAYMNGSPLAWPTLIAAGGGMAGFTRGYQPGHRLGIWVERKIGWQIFLQGIGIALGVVLGGVLGVSLGFAILPIILGPVIGGLLGKEFGRALWRLGSFFGWDRIWAALSAVGTAALGWVIAGLAATGGLSVLGPEFFAALEGSGVRPLLTSIVSGAFCASLGGLIAGTFADFIAGLLGLAD